MNAVEHLENSVWEHPSSYAGFSPDGDYLVCSRHRDSPIISESNYEVAFKQLRELAEKYGEPPRDDAPTHWLDRPSPRSDGWVYDWRASHCMVGWVEYLMVREDAPDEIKEAAGEILCAISDYPILDEDDYSEREMEAMQKYWSELGVRWRLEFLKDCKATCSHLAARHNYIPDDDYVFDSLREICQ